MKNKKVIICLFIVLSVSFVFLCKTREPFLEDDVKKLLDNDPPCLLTDEIKHQYKKDGKDACNLLGSGVCSKCSNCKWLHNKCISSGGGGGGGGLSGLLVQVGSGIGRHQAELIKRL